MTSGTIALWMYRNDGGDKIQQALKLKLEMKGHKVINNFDMRECYYINGNIFTKCGQNLSQVDVLYHMNADEQSQHQHEILRALDESSVIIINRWNAFEKAKDKFICNSLLKKNGVMVPPSALIPNNINYQVIERIFQDWKQVLFKPRSNHGGKGIIKFGNASNFNDFIQAMSSFSQNYYLEKYIDFDEHDYRVEIFRHQIIGGYCRTKTHEFKTNVTCGGLMTAISPPREFQEIALTAAKIIDIDATIVDMVKSKIDNKIYVLEVNPIMGIFVEEGMRSSEKSSIKKIDPIYANDDLKLEFLAKYLDEVVQQKHNKIKFFNGEESCQSV